MPRRFDFISPGVSIREIDQSQVSPTVTDDGILIIGQAPQGPANKPVKVRSLEDFYTVFGRPISGKGSTSTDVWRDGNQQLTTYAMYAAQAWLASNTSPVTFMRLLGDDQKSSRQASGYTKAGWNMGYAASTVHANCASAYGLFIAPSGTAATNSGNAGSGAHTINGKLAAIIYDSGSAWALSGAVVGFGDNESAGGSDRHLARLSTLIRSSTTGQANTFTLLKSDGTTERKYVVHFDRTQASGYIRNVLNCNPQKFNSINYNDTETYFLGETFDEAVNTMVADVGSSSAGEQYGILIPLSDGTNHYSAQEREATAPKTGWFINRNPAPKGDYANFKNESHDKLFRICALHEGKWMQNNYGIKIDNLRLGTTASPDSTFSVVLVDSEGEDVERFDNCTLNESRADFISKVIGDQYQEWNETTLKYNLYGEYPNRSDYIRVEMANNWKAGIADKRMLPFGVWGPLKPNGISFASGSTSAGSNTFTQVADDGDWALGHKGVATHFADLRVKLTCSFEFPDIKLTDEDSNNSGNYTKDYVFGARHMLNTDNRGKKVLWYSPDFKDLVRALPAGLSSYNAGTMTKPSWIFSLDDVRVDVDNYQEKFYFESGSHVAGNSYTATSGSRELITKGIKQFNAPFFGGADGLDIRQVDPFSYYNGLSTTNDETKHYAYHTVKKMIDIASDKDLMDFDMVSIPGQINSTITQDLIRMAEERSDTLAIVDIDSGYKKPYEGSGTETLGSSATIISNAQSADYDSSYAATYYPNVRIRDTAGPGEAVTVVPASVAALGAIARSEAVSDGPWFAPAGFNRGGIGVLGGSAGPRVVNTLEHLTKRNRDDLYEENINPIARFPSIGEIVIFGQKTLQQTPSALDRINVRRLMIYLKKRIGRIANTILFDQNVSVTWNRFKSRANAILADVKSRFGIVEYKLILDETTTTADLIDRNILYAKIFIKPARAIEFIAIDFIITKSGVEF